MFSAFMKDPVGDNSRKATQSLGRQGIKGEEQKGCQRFTRDTKDNLLIDKAVLKKLLKLKD